LQPSPAQGPHFRARDKPGLVAASGAFCYSCPLPKCVGYQRNGTTLFAVLNMLDGTVIGECMPRRCHREFLRFLNTIDERTSPNLDLHLIVNNYATHKTPAVKRRLKRHYAFICASRPLPARGSTWSSASKTTRKRIRGGVFKSVDELKQAIIDYLDKQRSAQALRLG
jgi:hypothetical protein